MTWLFLSQSLHRAWPDFSSERGYIRRSCRSLDLHSFVMEPDVKALSPRVSWYCTLSLCHGHFVQRACLPFAVYLRPFQGTCLACLQQSQQPQPVVDLADSGFILNISQTGQTLGLWLRIQSCGHYFVIPYWGCGCRDPHSLFMSPHGNSLWVYSQLLQLRHFSFSTIGVFCWIDLWSAL